jgi:hypothetical protein
MTILLGNWLEFSSTKGNRKSLNILRDAQFRPPRIVIPPVPACRGTEAQRSGKAECDQLLEAERTYAHADEVGERRESSNLTSVFGVQ